MGSKSGRMPEKFLTSEAKQFASSYRSLQLQTGKVVPFRNSFNPRLMLPLISRLSIFEIAHPDVVMVRLAGTAVTNLNRSNATGTNLLTRYPKVVRDRAKVHNSRLLQTPCGSTFLCHERAGSIFNVSEIVNYPLADASGKPTLILAIAADTGRREPRLSPASMSESCTFSNQRWLDIGAGVAASKSLAKRPEEAAQGDQLFSLR